MFEEDEFQKQMALANLMKFNIDKYQYPLTLNPGDIAGIFEINFKSFS